MTSLFGTAAAGGAVGLPTGLSMTLTQRSVMSSLGIPAASLLGGNPALAVASILVTGESRRFSGWGLCSLFVFYFVCVFMLFFVSFFVCWYFVCVSVMSSLDIPVAPLLDENPALAVASTLVTDEMAFFCFP